MKFGTLSDLMRLVGVDAHIDPHRRVFRLPRRAARFASASRFANSKFIFAQTKPPGMIQEGGISPLLGRFKGIPKGEIEIPLWRFLFTASGFFFAAQRKRG